MIPAFWDTSALVPLCVSQPASASARNLASRYEVVAWWATSVEMQSAFERLARMGQLTMAESHAAQLGLNRLRRGWREMQPSESLRAQAHTLLGLCPLRAADALQLAAALVWASGNPTACVFISGDEQLLAAAKLTGFQVVAS
jgi:predicted nucleic acid-binding protein